MNFKRTTYNPNLEGSIVCNCIQESQTIDKNETNTIKNIIQVCNSNSDNNPEYLTDTINKEIKKNQAENGSFLSVFTKKKYL